MTAVLNDETFHKLVFDTLFEELAKVDPSYRDDVISKYELPGKVRASLVTQQTWRNAVMEIDPNDKAGVDKQTKRTNERLAACQAAGKKAGIHRDEFPGITK